MSTLNRLPHMRGPSVGGAQPGQSPALTARINEKRAELENLKQLKELSGSLADQMEALETKLSTLSDGTEAVAAVLSNWHSILQAINMASMKAASTAGATEEPLTTPLPQTLVRIPADQQDKPAT